MYLLGFDIGSSSIKAALVDAHTLETLATAQYPSVEMEIMAPENGWAEQHPETWWECAGKASQQVMAITGIDPAAVSSIGIAYQMHGLVCLDKNGAVLRPSIIWCDSRAVAIGQKAFQEIGEAYCLQHYLNAPGNFTASKLKWVKEHQPALFARTHKIMLPGDYIAYRMTGEIASTVSGLSEGILWDFPANDVAETLLQHYGISRDLMPDLVPTFGDQGRLTSEAAQHLGLRAGTMVGYRAGDQPNNALSLNVLQPGEIAATGGTSGVVYGVVDQYSYDPQQRVNSFAHVNHTAAAPRIGILLCINGAGIQYSWMRQQVASPDTSYNDLEKMAASVPIGADGLCILPFGNGAERMLGNQNPGAKVLNLHFNRHTKAHLFRATLEGVAFSFVHGVQVLKGMGLNVAGIRVGNDNLFQSKIFSDTIAHLLDSRIEMLKTTGAVGAAIASGVAIGHFANPQEGLGALKLEKVFEPKDNRLLYQSAYEHWAENF